MDLPRESYENDEIEANEVNEADEADTSEVDDEEQDIENNNEVNAEAKDGDYYKAEGYYYKKDEQGRIESVSGTLELRQGTRNPKAQLEAGGEDREAFDDGGHLIATRFGGSGELDNLVPMSQTVNRRGGEYYELEESWAKELKEGNQVDVEIYVDYGDSKSKRPEGFDVMYTVTEKDGTVRNYHERIENEHLD